MNRLLLFSLLLLITTCAYDVTCSRTRTMSPRAFVRSTLPSRTLSKSQTTSLLYHATKSSPHIMSFHVMDNNNDTTSATPTTAAPTTGAPTNASTTTAAPTTVTPTTVAPTTLAPTTASPTNQSTTTSSPTNQSTTTTTPTTSSPTSSGTTSTPTSSTSTIDYPSEPGALITSPIISSGSVYNAAGNKVYYPQELNMLQDFRERHSSVILEMVETGWHDNTLVVLENTLTDTTITNVEAQVIRAYLVFQNGTRQEILEDYWSLSHPWYLGQTIGFNRDVSPTKVIITFEAPYEGVNPYYFVILGFVIMDLSVSSTHIYPYTSSQTTLSSLVTPFQIVEQVEPTYFEDGTVNSATVTIRQLDSLVVSQTQNILNYQLKPVAAVNDGVNNWPAGYLLLIRFRYFGGIRLIRYTDQMQPIYQTLLVPEIVDAHGATDLSELTQVVGYVQVDPDGHIYVLIDIQAHEIKTVSHYHRQFLGTRTTQSSILFLLDHTGTIIRADWVPIAYPSLVGQLTTSITVQQGDGHVAITHIGLTGKDYSEIASLIEYLDYNMSSPTYIPPPQSTVAMILTLPPMIRNDCVIASHQVAVYSVTALSTSGDYVVAGTHGYVQNWDENTGYPYIIYPGTAFVALLNLDSLLTHNYTSLYVENIGVRNRDNVATNVIPTSNGGYYIGTQLDRYILYTEKNASMRYERTTIFKANRNTRTCDPATTGWVTCGTEMCLSWCTALTPQAIDVNVNIVADGKCDVKNNVPPIELPSTGDNTDNSSPASNSSSKARAIGLGVGLGLGLGGICLLLIGCVWYRRHKQTTTRHTPVPLEGVGERAHVNNDVPHQPLTEEQEGGSISPNSGLTGGDQL